MLQRVCFASYTGIVSKEVSAGLLCSRNKYLPRKFSEFVRPRYIHGRFASTQSVQRPQDKKTPKGIERKEAEGVLTSTPGHLLKLVVPSPESKGDSLAFLLHPKQPLSYLTHLVQAEFPDAPEISFRNTGNDSRIKWSEATDIGDFIRHAAREGEFLLRVVGHGETRVKVPSFEERTQYLRERLSHISEQLHHLVSLKQECDRIARSGAHRLAMGV